MTTDIVRQNAQSEKPIFSDRAVSSDLEGLIAGWIAAERAGEKYPVPFELAWGIAGYSRKDNAKRKLTNKKSRLVQNRDYFLRVGECSQAGRFSDEIRLTCDAFKAFCLLAETEKGDDVRSYFIEAEKRWKIVQEIAPKISEEVEILAMKIELAKIEAQRAALEDKSLSFRHYVVTALPKPTADRILGVTEVKEVEYRDRVFRGDEVINTGDTINKTEICRMFGLISKSGAPNYKELKLKLAGLNIPASAWEEVEVIQTNHELKRSYLPELDRALYTAKQRQLWLGEVN